MLLRRRAMMGAADTLEGKIGSLAVGTLVTIAGVGTFILVHQGNPDESVYDSSCDGSWLLAQGDLGLSSRFGSNSNYASSTVAAELETDFIPLLPSSLSASILTVKIPYFSARTLHKLEDGLTCQAFIPAAIEFGYSPEYDPDVPGDGATLDYFIGANPGTGGSNTDPKREYSGDHFHWLRSPEGSSTSRIWTNTTGGAATARGASNSYDLRPCIILDKTTPLGGDLVVEGNT